MEGRYRGGLHQICRFGFGLGLILFNVFINYLQLGNSRKGTGYLKDRLLPYEPTRQLRSSQGALLKELSLKEVRGTVCRERALSAAAPLSLIHI